MKLKQPITVLKIIIVLVHLLDHFCIMDSSLINLTSDLNTEKLTNRTNDPLLNYTTGKIAS